MQPDRRMFLTGTGASLAALAGCARSPPAAGSDAARRYDELADVLARPVLATRHFPNPVVIESLELVRLGSSFLCRVRSADGAEGLSVAHSGMQTLFPVFLRTLQPFFLGKDARELDRMLDRVYVYNLNFRLGGMALGLPLATIEFAILDMLGRIAGQPVGRLIGDIHNPEVAVYVATEWRERPLEESMDLIRQAVAEYDIHALKIKVGGLMFMTRDMYAEGPPGRTEAIVPLVRAEFGDRLALYADANGFYDVPEAIRVGRLLEEHGFRYFEEPVMFDHLEDIRRVSDALQIPIANGEQDHSFYGFRWLLAHGGLDVVQPDNYYFGGLIRSMKVARLAEACGKTIIPHMSGGGLGYLYNIHFVSAVPNAGEHHEFKGLQTHVPFECPTSDLQVRNGRITVPTGPGFGVDFDPDWVSRHTPVTL